MKLLVEHIWKTNTFTLGELSVDGKPLCDTLEDRMRPNGEKVKGETAIPEGTYKIVLSYSPRFKRILPEILNVPNFSGVRIHSGNSSKDTEGCLLVGYWDGVKADWISSSKVAFTNLMLLLQKATDNNEEITITIKDIL